MSFSITYGLLVEVTLYHNYFLNNGEDTFEVMADADKEKMLQQFSTEAFTTIIPTFATNKTLKNYKMVFKKTKSGFRIYIKVKETNQLDPFIKIPADLNLKFLIKINDYQFTNYTDLDFAFNQVFLFSNIKPLTEPVSFEYIPKVNVNKLISNDYLVSEETTAGLLSNLESSEKQKPFGLISLSMKGDNVAGNIITAQGKMLSPNFKIHFDNRKTLWKYINRKAGTVIETNAVKPLTHSGFVELDPVADFTPSQPADNQYPNPSVKSITKINSDYYSEIFI